MKDTDTLAAPVAEKRPLKTTHHVVELTDDYAWLRDDNWQDVMHDPGVLQEDIRTHLEAENAHFRAAMESSGDLVETLFAEMKGRIKEDDSSVPAPDGPWVYFTKFVEGGQHTHFCRRPRDGGDEVVYLDGDKEAGGKPFFKLAGVEHSSDHKLLAYAVDLNGSEIYTIRFRDLETGEDLEDSIEGTNGDLEWAEDGQTLMYTVLDDNHRPCAVRRHRLGTDAAGDVEIYREKDPGFFVGVGKTESRKYLLISAHDHETSEVYLIDAEDPASDPRLIQARVPERQYDVSHHGGQLLILTNADGAEDFKVVTAPVDDSGKGNWTDLVPHEGGRLILGLHLFADYWVRLERVDGLPRLVVTEWASGRSHEIAFDEEAYSLGMSGGYEYDTATLRFTYSSMTTPDRVYDYDMSTRERDLRKEQEVPSGHDPADYVTRRLFAPAPDGETVPVSILYAKDTPLDGSAPVLLYGYGSYGYAIPAFFSTARLSLVDRGFVYAIAHIRGGMEKGYRWYTEGKREKKPNTFTDFIAAADHLIAEGATQSGRIAIHGGSAGGMLMGAVTNLRPELWGAVVAEVPFVDVLNTILDDTLPLTPPEWPEWGNPIENRDAFEWIRAYSPYDNVEAKAYPPILATAGLTDPRVTYWEPAKWVAKLRDLKTDTNPLLMKTNMEAGHGGKSGRFERLRETAEAYAFVIGQVADSPAENP